MPARALTAAPPLTRISLGNGLRVVIAPDASAPVVGVAVYYDVGFRSEPEGRTGFAHLFEHMMFQGSARVAKMEHPRLVQGAGGSMNGSTHPDFTNYYQAVPSNALDLTLWLEADRMRSPALTAENLTNQIAVVQNEIRVNVLNRPYGGFPWIWLPPVAFDSFPNAHNGYGDFTELQASSVEDTRDFFRRFYAPGNAVLAIAGDCDPDQTVALVHRHFADIPARRTPKRPSFSEPPLRAERRAERTDAMATAPAAALGWRAPHPTKERDLHLATVVLAEVLAEGDASRLQQRLVLKDRIAISAEAYLGTFGDPFEQRDPALFTVTAVHPLAIDPELVIAAVQQEIDAIADNGVTDRELARVHARLRAQLLRQLDQVLPRTLQLAMFEQQRGRAELVWELPDLVAQVSAEQVRAAAARLTADARSVLLLRAGAAA
ncbi:MAG TPA: pitrilysin family protein [Mycobacteriales bacterium]|nr:pitrilysin family protein [Mycobacteriales bacterium]